MKHFTFGRNNGLRVSELALGTATFGNRWNYGADVHAMRKMLDRFGEAGGTHLDTAASYQMGEAEENLGKLLAGKRDAFTIATKFSIGSPEGFGVLHTGAGRAAIAREVDGSLRRLGTDYIDLYWVHFPDGLTPIDETVRALDDLARAGKILYAGLSNFPAWLTSRAATLAELRGLIPIAGVQFEYSLVERSADREIMPMVEALGIGAALWSPLAGGLLTGKYRTSDEGRLKSRKRGVRIEDDERTTAVLDTVLRIAEDLGVAPDQAAMCWLLERARRSTTGVVPIIGPRTPEQLDRYLSALEIRLDAGVYDELDAVSSIDLGEPFTKLATEQVLALGGDADMIRMHPVPST